MRGHEHNARSAQVCFVRHNYYPSELNVKREAETLVRNGYGVSVICLRDEGEAAFETVNNVRVYRMPVGHRRGKILQYLWEYNIFFLLASLKLLILHVRRRFRVIQVNTMPDYLVFVALIPKLFGAKVVLHMHEPVPELFGLMFPKRYHSIFVTLVKWAEKMSLAFADRILTVTREMRENFGRRGADVNKITVIVNVPDDELFRPERYGHLKQKIRSLKKEDRRQGVFRILSHGAIEERYGFDLIVRAVSRLKDELPGIQFRFMGKGDYLENVMALAETLEVSRHLYYLGFVSFVEMVEEIMSADVCIVPVQKNAYSLLVHTNEMYEYISLEKPVVASKLDSVASYFPGDTVVFFEPGDDEDLAKKIFHVYAHPDDVEQRIVKVNAIYETYRWDRERKKYLGVYRDLLGS